MKRKDVSVQHVRRRTGDTAKMAAQLAPLEEKREPPEANRTKSSPVVAQEDGAIVVGVEQEGLAKEVIAEERSDTRGLEPVVIVIVGLLLAFIVFIAWQISQMPAPKDIN